MYEVDFGAYLVEKALITPEQLGHARWVQDRTGEPDLTRILQDLGFINRYTALAAKAGYHGTRTVDLPEFGVDPEATYLLPGDVATRHLVLPVRLEGITLVVATSRPEDALADTAVRHACGRQVQWVVAPLDQIVYQLIRFYRQPPEGFGPQF